ncbi:homeobox 4 [Fusarium beomiforme]|uniref:Homeobox 4 n=1 Tax=Fusarium beomiforme TaxID=44412 RepID=A0A9P5AIW5_9HYPO|nr:homeobox 4 [Fusarium beomiforme]
MEENSGYSDTFGFANTLFGDFTDLDQILGQPGDSISGDGIDLLQPEIDHGTPGFGDVLDPGNVLLGDLSYTPQSAHLPVLVGNNGQTQEGDNPLPPKTGKRLSLNSVRILNKWLSSHTHHPYPSVRDVESMERQTGLSRQQILNWFANARRRKKFKPLETTDNSSSEASPRDIPLHRPPTPMVQQSPLERWENSPPEDEPSSMAAIARAVSGASDSIELSNYRQLRSARASSSAGTWATTDTSDSSRSSQASAYSYTSNVSLRRVIKKRRRGGLRARTEEKRGLALVCHRFQCTFCTETFKLKHTWSRHEKTQHLSLEQWECSPFGPTAVNQDAETVCVYCGLADPDNTHLEKHNHDLCHKREWGERTFYRKDHLRQHLRLVHGSEFVKWPMEEWKSKHEDVVSRCGFCGITMTTWSERVDHLAEHFKEGRTMADWKGNWGFDAVTLEMVENSMPPYLIDYERNSPLPFSTQQGAPYSSTSAFELLQLELHYFYSNYTDIHQSIPPDETLHLEACCIIFGAEMNYRQPSTASSWLRDLIMGTEDIVNKARMTPMKSAARSRFSELKIHSKNDIFEDCKLEASLRQYVDMLQLLNMEIGDDELQKEACSIINHMPDVSPMFSQLLIGLVYNSTGWLAAFRERVGLPPSESLSSAGQGGILTDFMHLSASNSPQAMTTPAQSFRFSPSSGINSSSMLLGQKIVSLNDGNMYRGLTRDLTRYVARTISPLNPTSHVPTDEELQYQARWIMYDSHDVWNQTPADNQDWLAEFKRESGFF